MSYSTVDYSTFTTSRLSRINIFLQAIGQNREQQDELFQGLHQEDRARILAIFTASGIPQFSQEEMTKRAGLKGRLQTELRIMQRELRKVALLEKQGRNPFPRVPHVLMSHALAPFLSSEERTAFQISFVGDSSLTASRFHRLSRLSKAIMQDKPEAEALFRGLHKDDRARILAKFPIQNFDWTVMNKVIKSIFEKMGAMNPNEQLEFQSLFQELLRKNQTFLAEGWSTEDLEKILAKLGITEFGEMINLRATLLKEIKAMKDELGFHNTSLRPQRNSMQKLPTNIKRSVVGQFLLPEEMVHLRTTDKSTLQIPGSASNLIKTHHLEPLIETYLHCSCETLDNPEQEKVLGQLMSMAFKLSEIEKLPRPSYQSLASFFELVEARNLIRMIKAINEKHRSLPYIEGLTDNFQIPQDSTETLEKAKTLRKWIEQDNGVVLTLEGLNLFFSGLSLLPKEIGKFKALRMLDAGDNSLVSIPQEIGGLKALKTLDLRGNGLRSLPKEIVELTALKQLDLSGNGLRSLPKEIFQLEGLLELFLNNNRLTRLPKKIRELAALQELGLHNNQLTRLPKEIGYLTSLQRLGLNNNQLVSFPNEIGQFRSLDAIDFRGNGLIDLPRSLKQHRAQLRQQNQELQLKNIVRQLLSCFKKEHDIKELESLLKILETFFGKKIRSRLHQCLFEVVRDHSQTDRELRKKLKDRHFGRKAFFDEGIKPQFKAIAILKFWRVTRPELSLRF